MSDITDWITAASTAVGACGIFFLGLQTKASLETLEETRKQGHDDHERSRRQSAVDLLKSWNDSVAHGEPSARYVVEKFTPEECQHLLSMTPFRVPTDRMRNLRNAMLNVEGFTMPIADEQGLLLSEDCLFHLGRLCHKFLSALEITLIAWRNNTADNDTLYQQLSFVVKPHLNFYCLENFRAAMGGVDAYPNIQAFVDEVKKIKTQVPNVKPSLGNKS